MHRWRPAVANVVFTLATTALAAGAQSRGPDTTAVGHVRAELQALIRTTNAALERRDRPALERLYADEYIWVHANGYVNDRATHLAEELAVDSVALIPLTLAPPEELRVYGDVAIVRRPFRSAVAMYRDRPALSTWIFARRDGRWQIVQQQVTMLQPERTPANVATILLDAYAGTYGDAGRVTMRVVREGTGLVARGVPLRNPPRVLVPASDSTFFDKVGTEYVFERGAEGQVVALVVRPSDGRILRRERMR